MPETILDKIHDLVIFFGDCGSGKSSLMVHFADEYVKTQGIARWELSEQILREANANRKTPLSMPAAPPVYSNMHLTLRMRNGIEVKSIYLTGADVGISNDEETYKSLYPGSLLIIDEAHTEFCSKNGELSNGQRDFFNKHRHNRLDILLASPRAVLINKDIRNAGARFIEVRRKEDLYDGFRRIYKTTWYCREFSNKTDLEEYIRSDGASGAFTERTYIHKGNVFALYNSFEFLKDFLPPEGMDFET